MNIFSLAIIVLVGILFFVLFFHLSNLILDYYGRIYKKSYAFENQSMPNRRIYVFRWTVWIRRYAYRFSESNKIWDDIRKGSSSEFREIDAIGYIDFKAMNQLLRWDD